MPAPSAFALCPEPDTANHGRLQSLVLSAYRYPLNGDTMSHGKKYRSRSAKGLGQKRVALIGRYTIHLHYAARKARVERFITHMASYEQLPPGVGTAQERMTRVIEHIDAARRSPSVTR